MSSERGVLATGDRLGIGSTIYVEKGWYFVPFEALSIDEGSTLNDILG